jgi:hypothetical protein
MARDEYLKQFIARTAFTSSPIPGVSIDVNDLGIVGGSAIALLMLVLVFYLMREHENLYLALYKVRQLARAEYHEHGDSEANLLYHALVMNQVLASPPTLARWRDRGVLHHFGAIYFLPAAVYGWVIYTNKQTEDIARAYIGASVHKFFAAQLIIGAIVLALSAFAWINSRAMAQRWASAFRAVNPARHHVPQMSWWQWLRLPRVGLCVGQAGLASDHLQAQVLTELIDTFRAHHTKTIVIANRTVAVPNIRGSITSKQLRRMMRKLCRRGQFAARRASSTDIVELELVSIVVRRNCIEGRTWKVTADWTFRGK